jgi:hypothetical protein
VGREVSRGTGGYAAAVELARAVDQLRVLTRYGMATEYDREGVRSAMARYDGEPAPRSLQGANRIRLDTPPRNIQPTIDRYIKTGVWR